MTTRPVVLDSAALSDLAAPGRRGPSPLLRALLNSAWEHDREVLVPAVVCAEVCRGRPRTHAVEALLSRLDPVRGRTGAIRVVDTDFELARTVGAILFGAHASTPDLVDAHLVALCLPSGGGLVVTSDPDDVHRLAARFPGLRVITRPVRDR